MKCTNCGNDVTGKFCTNCGTPAPVENTQPASQESVEPMQYTPAPEQNTQPMQYNPAPQQGVEPVQNVPVVQQGVEPMPYDYATQQNTAPQQTSFGQQFTNNQNNAYSGQQFTNSPNKEYSGQQFTNTQNNNYSGQQFTNGPKMKKGLSGGKLAAVIISIILGVIILLGIVIGVAACGIVKASKSAFDSMSSIVEDFNEDYESDINSITNEIESDVESEFEIDADDNLDDASHCQFKETDNGIIITGYDNFYDFETAKMDIVIPSEINGKPVVEIEDFTVFDNDDSDNGYIKVTVPSTVKVIDEYAMSFCDINEVVIEDGVEIIQEYAFIGADDLKKITIPASVTSMDGSFIGFECDDDTYEEEVMDGFVMYGKKGSEAEAYAKENNLKFIAK